jgi:hypothetical protein
MRSDRQPVATHGKGFALISPVSPPGDFERRCRCVRVAGEAESDARVEGTLQIISIRAFAARALSQDWRATVESVDLHISHRDTALARHLVAIRPYRRGFV